MNRKLKMTLALCGCVFVPLPLGFADSPKKTPSGAHFTTDHSGNFFHIDSTEIFLEPLPTQKRSPVVTALSASQHGEYLAAAGDDHSIRVIKVATGRVVSTLLGHRDWIQTLCFAPNSHKLYSAGDDGRVLKWSHLNRAGLAPDQAATQASSKGYAHEELFHVPFAIRSLAISSDEKLLAVAGFSQEIIVWDLLENRIARRLTCKSGDLRVIRFSAQSNKVLAGGRAGDLYVWQTQTGKELAHFHVHSDRIHTAEFDPLGESVTSAANDRQLIHYSLKDAQVAKQTELGPAKLRSMCLMDSDWIAVSGADNSVHLYDQSENRVLAHLKGHTGTVAAMTKCGRFLASGSFDTTIRLWDLQSIDLQAIEVEEPNLRKVNRTESTPRIR